MQACQYGVRASTLETQPVELSRPNSVLLMAAKPNDVALRGAYTGAFSEALKNSANGADICEIHSKAVTTMMQFDKLDQLPSLTHTLRKPIFLAQKLSPNQTGSPTERVNVGKLKDAKIEEIDSNLKGTV